MDAIILMTNFDVKTTRTSMRMRKRKLSYPPTVRHELRQTTEAENREEVYDGYYSMDSEVLIVPCGWPFEEMCNASLNWYVLWDREE
jgi:hypothetical protein